MDRAELLSGFEILYGNSTRSLWTTYLVLPAPSNLWKLPATPRIRPRCINEPTQNRQKIHLQQSRKHRNRKKSVKFWPAHSLQNAPQRHRHLQLKPHSSSTALQMSPSEMRWSLCWTKISCPTSLCLMLLGSARNATTWSSEYSHQRQISLEAQTRKRFTILDPWCIFIFSGQCC